MKSGNIVMRALSCIMSIVNRIAVLRYIWLRPTESNELKLAGKLYLHFPSLTQWQSDKNATASAGDNLEHGLQYVDTDPFCGTMHQWLYYRAMLQHVIHHRWCSEYALVLLNAIPP